MANKKPRTTRKFHGKNMSSIIGGQGMSSVMSVLIDGEKRISVRERRRRKLAKEREED